MRFKNLLCSEKARLYAPACANAPKVPFVSALSLLPDRSL
jgi:hypothetical protein